MSFEGLVPNRTAKHLSPFPTQHAGADLGGALGWAYFRFAFIG